MKRFSLLRIIPAAALLLMLPLAAEAQQLVATDPSDPSAPPAAAPAAQATYSEQQLDQLTAPVALYPDQLLTQVLMASTYPLEVVQADRWLQTSGNAQLQGDQLQAALNAQPWDPSVKSLVPFPQVLAMMNQNLQWTEQLGDAFLANQNGVMGSVQRLRGQAQAAGNLQSTPQQTVAGAPGAVEIEPANPQVVYVPTYNPQSVYGTWLYPDYPPYYFAPPPGYVYTDVGPFAFFATGIILADWFWGWDHWDWYHHYVDIDRGRFEALNRGRAPNFSGDEWAHNPAHRDGVPYRNAAVRSQFQPAEDAARRNYRGYAPAATPRAGVTNAAVHPQLQTRTQYAPQSRAARPQLQQHTVTPQTRVAPQTEERTAAPQTRAAPQAQERSSPMFESFSRGSDVRAQSARGAYSRATTPAVVRSAPAAREAPAARQAPAARSAPSGGGNRDNRDHH